MNNMMFHLCGIFLLFLNTADAFAPGSVRHQHIGRQRQFMAKDSDNDSGMTDEEHKIAMEKATKAMTAFTNKYLKNTGTYLCTDSAVPAVVIKGLAEHKVNFGSPLCPCRFYEDKPAEVAAGYWNCPCVPMRERHECHCMLFLTEDNAFAGSSQVREGIHVQYALFLINTWTITCVLIYYRFSLLSQHITVDEVVEKTGGFETD